MSHRISTEAVGDRTVYRLHDDASGASASILPSYGFNLFDLRLPAAGQARPIVYAAPGWEAAPEKPGRNGVPVLFPFPNRIREGRYPFGGRSYQLPLTKPPHAIHGFAIEAPWDVVEHEADDSSAFITGRFQISQQAPAMLANWPADAVLEIRYRLSGRRLTLEATVTNPTGDDLPWGFGIHPYFRCPMTPGGDLTRTAVVLPASEEWVQQDSLPTGERREVGPALDFRSGKPMAGLVLDDVLTGLEFDGDRCTCRLLDRSIGAEFRLSFDRTFRELVIFTPPAVEGVIAVEPYTQTTDAINLQPLGVDAGLRVLRGGDQARFAIAMETAG